MLVNKTFTSTKEESPMELLWTNPNPTSEFSPQVISLPTGYTAFAVEFLWHWSSSYIKPAILCIPFFEAARFYTAFKSTSPTSGQYLREIKYAQDGSISFGNCINFGSTYNRGMIPQNIWGLKFTV